MKEFWFEAILSLVLTVVFVGLFVVLPFAFVSDHYEKSKCKSLEELSVNVVLTDTWPAECLVLE